jgi:hypothetical protein
VKTQQVGKGLAVAVVICEFWRLASALRRDGAIIKWNYELWTVN